MNIRYKIVLIALILSSLALFFTRVVGIVDDILASDPTSALDPRVHQSLQLTDGDVRNIVSAVRRNEIALFGPDPILGIAPNAPSTLLYQYVDRWVAVYTGEEGKRGTIYYFRKEDDDWVFINRQKILF